ncbi:diphosphoinositol polyphosphate phosphohydrolase 1-like isoform X2 [Lampetra fluviatilis]
MKYKPNQTRTFDGDGYRKRAACLCFRSESEQEVLLVSSSRYPDKWIVPGGGMEPEEEASVAAMREVYEEAGVKGDLGRLLGVFEERKHRTYVYILIVTEILEDWEDSVNIGKETHAPSAAAAATAAAGRKRGWFSVDAAIECLQGHKPVQASYLQKHKQGGPAGEDSAATVNNGATPTTPVVAAAAAATEDKAATHPIASTPDVR